MANKIKVLGLDDNNHPMCFITLGSYYDNVKQFMYECLLDAHSVSYDLRVVHIINLPKELKTIDNIEIETMFDLLTCERHPYRLCQENDILWQDRNRAFELFWRYGEKEYSF